MLKTKTTNDFNIIAAQNTNYKYKNNDYKKSHKKLLLKLLIGTIIIFILTYAIIYIFVVPTVKYNGSKVETVEYGTIYIDKGINVHCRFKDVSNSVITENNVDTSKLGNYNVTYKIPYLNGYKTYIRQVNVVDTTSPQIELTGGENYTLSYGAEYQEPGYTATDNYDGDITKNVTTQRVDIDENNFEIHYTISDSSGNKFETTRYVTKADSWTGIIYLTFDDGPSSSSTSQILDILKEKGVNATFFILNYNDSTEELVKRELEEGNSIGIHGYSHSYQEVYQSVEACYNNITTLQEKIYNSTGVTVKIIRFIGGSSNTVSKKYCEGIMTQITQKVLEEGFKYYDWNVDSGDASSAKTKEDVYNNVIAGIKPGRSNFVLMHDFANNTKTIEALPDIIDYGLQNGYKFEVITEDTEMITQKIAN